MGTHPAGTTIPYLASIKLLHAHRRAEEVRDLIKELQDERDACLPPGTIVLHVSAFDPETGTANLIEGIVVADSSCPAHQVPIFMSSGNVWWKPLDTVFKHGDTKRISSSLRVMYLKRRGYHKSMEACRFRKPVKLP